MKSISLRFVFNLACLLACAFAPAGGAWAAEAGRIVFVVGDAKIAGRAALLDQAVHEGDEIATKADGYIYLKTIDDGFLILRPKSRARILAYHVDLQDHSKTRIKLELLSGVARHISGAAVKQARESFRFNTPVAAIGVRGTDFTVFTDQETSRVVVVSGGIVVSGFSGNCGPEGGGPCEGASSRELFANQAGQLLQVHKGQVVPQLLRANGLSPDLTAPPRPDEPVAKGMGNTSLSPTEPSLDPQKSATLEQLKNTPVPPAVAPPPAAVVPPVVVAPPPVIPPVANPPLVTWGRWQAVLDQAANADVTKLSDANQLLAINAYYVLMRSKGTDWQIPDRGRMGFALQQGEANILNESTHRLAAATLENGKLQVDFANTSFSTSFDLVSAAERFKLQSQGAITRDGQLVGEPQYAAPTNMVVNGVLSPANGGSAAYLFQSRIDANRLASGATYWTKSP